MSNLKNIIAFLIAVGMAVGVFLMTSPSEEDLQDRDGGAVESSREVLFDEDISGTFNIKSWEYENENTAGNPKAPVLLEQYSDYACSYCVDFWRDVMPKIKEEFIDTGYVKYVYNDFITIGGQEAAEVAWCANEQGAFWQYHDALYSRAGKDRHKWGLSELHEAYAEELGLNKEKLLNCFKERRYEDLVRKSKVEGKEKGVTGAPFFFVNGEPIVGFRDFDHFEQIIYKKMTERFHGETQEEKEDND